MKFIVNGTNVEQSNGCVVNDVCGAKACGFKGDPCAVNAEPCAANGSIN